MKNVKKKDIILVAVIAALALVLLAVGLSTGRTPKNVKPAADSGQIEIISAEPTPAPAAQEIPEEVKTAVDAYLAENPAESYLLISTAAGNYLPVPLNGDAAFKVHFGEDEYNIVHIGKNSVYMESSTCENQNCVGQGEVTLENRDTRVLMDMILCLPHELSLQLVDPATAEEFLTDYYLAVAAYAQMAGGSENAG